MRRDHSSQAIQELAAKHKLILEAKSVIETWRLDHSELFARYQARRFAGAMIGQWLYISANPKFVGQCLKLPVTEKEQAQELASTLGITWKPLKWWQ